MGLNAGTIYSELVLRAEEYFDKLKKADAEMKSFANKLKSHGKDIESIGETLTKKVTLPVAGLVTAAAGVVAAFGWKRLTGLDAAQAQLKGLGYELQDVERISKQVGDAVRGTVMTMAEGTSVATGALAAGVKEGDELVKYIKLVGSAAVGAGRDVGDMAMIFNRVQGAGKLMTQELNMIEMGMPGFAMAMSNALGVSQSEFRKMVTDGKISSEQFLTVMEDFAGGMADSYAESWAGMVSNTKANIGIIGQNLLEGVFVQSKESIAEFLEMLRSDTAKQWAKETGAKIGEAFEKLVDGAKSLINWWNGLSDSTKTMIGIMGGVTVAAGPVLTVTGKLIQGIEKVNVVTAKFGGVMGLAQAALNPWVLGIGAAVVAGTALYSHLSQDSIPAVKLFGDEVSENTKKAVGSFLDLEEKATIALTELSWNGDALTEELAEGIIGNFEGMKKQVLAELEDQRQKSLIIIEELFEGSWAISEKDREEMLRITDEKYKEQIEKTEEGHKRITEIIEGAAKENRELTEEEKREINGIKEEMKKDAVRILSESETEQLAIMERLRAEGGKISALQASEIVKSSYEQKIGAIAEAKDEYNQRLKIAAQLRVDGSEEGRIMADKIIGEAKRQREKAIEEAEEMHSGVVAQAKLQAEEHAKYVDWETGEIKSKWKVFWEDMKTRREEQDKKDEERREKMQETISETYTKIKDKTLEIYDKWVEDRKNREEKAEREAQERREKMQEAISETWNKIKENTINKVAEIGNEVVEKWEKLRDDTIEWGKNLVTGLWTGITDKAKWLYDEITGFAKNIADRFTSFWKIASDSKLMIEFGRNIVNGLATAIDTYAYLPEKSMDELSQKISDSMKTIGDFVKNTVGIIEKEFELWKLQNQDLQGSSEELEMQLEMQRQKHELLTEEVRVAEIALEDIVEAYGEGSKAALEYRNNVFDLRIAQQKLTNEIESTAKAIENMADAQSQIKVMESGEIRVGQVSYSSGSSKSDAQKSKDVDKYGDEIMDVAKRQNVDMGVAYDMWKANQKDELMGKTPRYALGTDHHLGGWAWVGEGGRELINLPRGTKVYGHDESERMVRGNKSIEQNIHIYSPEPLSPSDISRKCLQTSRQLAMEWGV